MADTVRGGGDAGGFRRVFRRVFRLSLADVIDWVGAGQYYVGRSRQRLPG
jgi:hypothetical protein